MYEIDAYANKKAFPSQEKAFYQSLTIYQLLQLTEMTFPSQSKSTVAANTMK